jgi:hypothetical protein
MWSQIATTSQKRRRADALPFAFTEQGVAMLSSVLRSRDEYDVRGRRWMDRVGRPARRPSDREGEFAVVFEAIKQLVAPPDPPKRQIGFTP